MVLKYRENNLVLLGLDWYASACGQAGVLRKKSDHFLLMVVIGTA